jgi:hypothetical protein
LLIAGPNRFATLYEKIADQIEQALALADGRIGAPDKEYRATANDFRLLAHLAGRVALVSYLGNTLRYDLETTGGLVLKADIRDPWHHDPLPVGHEVTATFPGSVTLALSDDASPAGS